MTRHRLLSTALLVLFGIGGLSAVRAAEPKPALTKKELKTAIANAKTPEEHYRIAAYFTKQAERMLAEAREHDELATLYAKSPNPAAMKQPMSGRTAEHCKYFAEYARKAAQQDQELAKMHEDMAKQAK
jgi:acyl-CoA reductase-like NAD-dependent aldehyde dehydrogenase